MARGCQALASFRYETLAGDKRLIGDVLLDADLGTVSRRRLQDSRTTPAARSSMPVPTPFGRVVAGHGNDGESGYEGCRVAAAVGTYLHGPLLPRNPELADWLLAKALEHGGGHGPLEPLGDELERLAHAVSSGRARRGAASSGSGFDEPRAERLQLIVRDAG